VTRRASPETVEAAVRELSIFDGLADEAVEELCRMAICHDYPRGNILHYAGDPCGPVYMVLAGEVKISLTGEDAREVVVDIVRPGGFFGLVATLDGGDQPTDALTVVESTLARFRGAAFLEWARKNGLSDLVLRELVARVRMAYQRIGEHALLGVKDRLWSTLLEIADREGEIDEGEIVFLRPTHKELAHRIGSSREVVTRLLKELLDSDLLESEGRVIRVSESALVLRED
jgi:CRP/FNR family transcriptional regulator, cyclic AMP receptor protein